MKVAVLDINGKDTGRKADLSKDVFAIEPNNHAVYLDVKQYLAHQRQGTHKAKERGEITGSTRKIKKQKGKHKERLQKLELQLDLSEKTKDYAIGTSLRNYIDPRVFKAWTDEVGAEWEKLYTAALQKKFLWVKEEDVKWKDLK